MQEILRLIHEMSPYLLLGFFIAGLMHAFVPGQLYSKFLSGNNLRSVLYAALFGIPLPLCSCGVIPTAMSLRKEGASRGATTAFLIATPQTGVDSIFATYSLLGLPFAILRPVAALVTSVFGGTMVNRFATSETDAQKAAIEAEIKAASCAIERKHTSILAKMGIALRYGFVDMMRDIGKWLLIGLVVAELITLYVPDNFFIQFTEIPFLSYIVVLLIAIPMYVCATGSIPIAAALMLKGLSPGAALILLMAGPAANMASVLVINRALGRRNLVVYLMSLVLGALGFALLIDYAFPREWFTHFSTPTDACHHIETPWFQWASTLLLGALLIYTFIVLPLWRKLYPQNNFASQQSEDEASFVRKFSVEGMTCNHCRNHVEKAILGVEGVTQASVSLEDGEGQIIGTASDEDIIKAVGEIGYQLHPKS